MRVRTIGRKTPPFLVACLLGLGSHVLAQAAAPDHDPVAVVEVGGAVSKTLRGGESGFGPNFAVEVTPIEHWLELEAGVSPLWSRHAVEWDTDLLFKKPWTLSRRVEFMFGAGPEWVHTRV
ncbi:MAG TPA: hypothetical protein VFP94_00665, partial [Terriglobales bacterium]|nr:hypothetical protein [Terriglobales bacterium]